jgi:hypothetical protein
MKHLNFIIFGWSRSRNGFIPEQFIPDSSKNNIYSALQSKQEK